MLAPLILLIPRCAVLFFRQAIVILDEFSKTFHEIDVAINNLLVASVPELKDPTNKDILNQYKDQQKDIPSKISSIFLKRRKW